MITTNEKIHSLVFGPISSRRLGVSLGIDLTPKKFCDLNCIFCECGKTTNLILGREEFYPLEFVKEQIRSAFKDDPTLLNKIDYITFSGNGEPTLYSRLGEVIDFLKAEFPQKAVCLITNSTLFDHNDLHHELAAADLIVPTISTTNTSTFKKLCAPHGDLNLDKILEGLLTFSHSFRGEIWPEVFILEGINDDKEGITNLKNYLLKLNHQKIQLNTLDRPGRDTELKSASLETLEDIKKIFSPPLKVEIYPGRKSESSSLLKEGSDLKGCCFNDEIINLILKTIDRRPSTLEDLRQLTNLPKSELLNLLNNQIKAEKITQKEINKIIYFQIKN